jgi:bifunctional non-homologous end joining protein LigD
MIPFKPMSPILSNEIPSGPDWGYQLKWDGYRILAWVENGEAVILDAKTQRPRFQMLQKPDRIRGEKAISRAAERNPVQYIIFDLLQAGEEDLRQISFRERHERLQIMGSCCGNGLRKINGRE